MGIQSIKSILSPDREKGFYCSVKLEQRSRGKQYIFAVHVTKCQEYSPMMLHCVVAQVEPGSTFVPDIVYAVVLLK